MHLPTRYFSELSSDIISIKHIEDLKDFSIEKFNNDIFYVKTIETRYSGELFYITKFYYFSNKKKTNKTISHICDYFPNGNIRDCIYYNSEGVIHNENGPAYFLNSKNGQTIERHYYINGLIHNNLGPAIIIDYKRKDYSIAIGTQKNYYLNNKRLSKKEWFEQLDGKSKAKVVISGMLNEDKDE
jgi:hypothetical protein